MYVNAEESGSNSAAVTLVSWPKVMCLSALGQTISADMIHVIFNLKLKYVYANAEECRDEGTWCTLRSRDVVGLESSAMRDRVTRVERNR